MYEDNVQAEYQRILEILLRRGHIASADRVLVCCGGALDRDVFAALGFTDVTISNVDSRLRLDGESPYPPYGCRYLDVEDTGLAAGAYDVVVAHNGLHHCHSPHRALTEMYRVAARAVIVFEPHDTMFTRITTRLGIGQQYEVLSVLGNERQFGGVANTEIPNFVYRWSPREVRAAISAFAPHVRPRLLFFPLLRLPMYRLAALKSTVLKKLLRLLAAPMGIIARFVPALNNNLAFVVLKPQLPEDLHDWLELRDGHVRFREDYSP